MKKLHGHIDFRGLDVSVENRKGSIRHWHDHSSGEAGTTKMLYPYGYIKSSLGTDGDAVDVYVGPDETSEKVFVITQMTAPDFVKVDEQKVMLGFKSASEAKEAYLKHYNNPKFFGAMKELSVDEFKQKLESNKGKLIKHLFVTTKSATIHPMPFVSENNGGGCGQKWEVHSKSTGRTHKEGETCEKRNGGNVSKAESTIEILKSLTSRMLSTLTPRKADAPMLVDSGEPVGEVTLFGPQVAQAAFVNRPFEQPVATKVLINTPMQAASPLSPDFMTSCGSCGYTHKSLSECPRCTTIQKMSRESTPIWRR